MAISRTQKEEQVQLLKQKLGEAKLTVLVAYKGLSVPQAQQLRKDLKENSGSFHVVKNAMLKLALADVYKDIGLGDFEGPVAVAFGYEDPVQPAKVVVDFSKKHEFLQPIAAINDKGELFTSEQVNKLASLPSREQLTAQLVGTIAAPLSGFVTVLSGNLRGLVTVLDAAAKANEA